MSKWQKIETAPKDGTTVLLYPWPGQAHGVMVGVWEAVDEYSEWHGKSFTFAGFVDDYYSQEPIDWEPTHWMPLPEPPEEEND